MGIPFQIKPFDPFGCLSPKILLNLFSNSEFYKKFRWVSGQAGRHFYRPASQHYDYSFIQPGYIEKFLSGRHSLGRYIFTATGPVGRFSRSRPCSPRRPAYHHRFSAQPITPSLASLHSHLGESIHQPHHRFACMGRMQIHSIWAGSGIRPHTWSPGLDISNHPSLQFRGHLRPVSIKKPGTLFSLENSLFMTLLLISGVFLLALLGIPLYLCGSQHGYALFFLHFPQEQNNS